uniref:FYVE-type domain-containing protein n=1 Tax=Globisporangium ultimum (strain ATCC 200006 / CBS 805.95 / DAOM BR144) TaxID=431595 RepID=K3WRW4_GLOUD
MAIMGATADRATAVDRSATANASGRSAEWRMPTLLMLGSIVGSLDDVMYGASTFDAPSMLLKTTYTHDELIDGEILNQIQGPTPEEPFTFLGIKWIVKGNHSGIASVVRPRDLVILESTGIETRWNGERYGYHLMHSVDLPEYGPLKRKSVLRGRVSSCVVYRELANGTVDVYMKANFEPNGNVGESVAILSAANGLSYCWRSVVCAQNKKLSWMLETKENWTTGGGQPRSTTASIRATDTSNGKKKSKDKHACCSVCRKSANAFRHMSSCQLCQFPMCSRCRVTKKLSCVGETWRKEILQQDVTLCKSCVTRSTKSDTYQVARDEVLSGKWDVDESDNLSFELLPRQQRNTQAEHEQQRRRKLTTDNGFDRTLKLSIARMQSEEDAGSSYAESFPISGNLWPSSFESDTQLEGDFRYTENTTRPSELPPVRTSTNFVNVSSTDASGATTPSAAARSTQPSHFVDLSDVTSSEFARFSSQFNQPKEESAYPMYAPSCTRRSAASSASSTGLSQHQQQLLHQMEQLRVAAEQVYQYTKHNSEVHARSSTQQWPSVR